MARVTITLQEDERNALVELAVLELRDPREQAKFILRQELIRRGLLKSEEKEPNATV